MEPPPNLVRVWRALCARPTDSQWSSTRACESGIRTNETSPPDPARVDFDSPPEDRQHEEVIPACHD